MKKLALGILIGTIFTVGICFFVYHSFLSTDWFEVKVWDTYTTDNQTNPNAGCVEARLINYTTGEYQFWYLSDKPFIKTNMLKGGQVLITINGIGYYISCDDERK